MERMGTFEISRGCRKLAFGANNGGGDGSWWLEIALRLEYEFMFKSIYMGDSFNSHG